MRIEPLRLAGTYRIELRKFSDDRGYFVQTYEERRFSELGLATAWVQENQSVSVQKGLIRGLHFQRPPHAQAKLVRVAAGAALDAFVDLRPGSPTYGEWDTIELSEENQLMVYIPVGFAHGFCTLADHTLVLYKVDDYYAPETEGGIIWNDEKLRIPWPTTHPLLSPKDRILPRLDEIEPPF